MKKWRQPAILAIGAVLGTAGLLSAQVDTGKPAPEFTLPAQDGTVHKLSDFKGKYVVLEWFNKGCPFVVKHYGSGNMQKLQETYAAKGVVWLSIISSAEGKQGHQTPAEATATRAEWKIKSTATLLDSSGLVGKLYGAKTTPHLFVINPEGVVVYQGAIDSKASTDPKDIPTSKNYVAAALDAVLAGKPVAQATTKPYGCSVKYAN